MSTCTAHVHAAVHVHVAVHVQMHVHVATGKNNIFLIKRSMQLWKVHVVWLYMYMSMYLYM